MKNFLRFTAVLLLSLSLTSCSSLQEVFQQEEETPNKTTTAQAEVGDLVLGLSADGSITLPVTGLDFAVSGIIKNIYVETGDIVEEGDLLAELDDTDLQLALKTAQNKLEQAQLSYEEALASADYKLQTETLNLESKEEQLNASFDSYSYEQTIANAELSLERKNQTYTDTELSNQTSEEAARLTLSRKEEDLLAKQRELEEAQAKLAEAENEEIEDLDTFTLENNITSAEINVERLGKTLKAAQVEVTTANEALSKAELEYNTAMNQYQNEVYESGIYYGTDDYEEPTLPDDSAVTQARDTVKQKKNAVTTAQNNYDDAVRTLEIRQEELTREESSNEENQTTSIETAIESAQAAVESAEKAMAQAQRDVDDAQTTLNNKLDENSKSLIKARQDIDDAESALLEAQVKLDQGQDDFQDSQRDAQNAYELQALSLANTENSELAIKKELSAIEDAKNAVETAENNLAQTKITATIGGEILNVTKKAGEKVTESEDGANMFMGSDSTSNSFVTIRDLSEIYMTASVPEGDIVGLEVGQKINVEVDALEAEVTATVYSISSIPTTDSSGIITYEIVGVLDEFNENIRDSMSVFLTFIKREVNGVLLIPTKAVNMDENSQQYVYIELEDGTLERRDVVCGFSNGTQTEVNEGLEAGETVVVGKVTL